VPPVVGLNTNSIAPPATSGEKIANGSSLTLYFGYVYFNSANIYNKSRPVDDSFNLSLQVVADPGPISVTVYLRGSPVFSAQTNATVRTIWCNSTLYASNKTTAGTIVYPNIVHSISVSLLDAFTGGTTPYMVIQNLNSTSPTSVSYFYSYTAKFRNSDGLPILLFIVGVIIAVIEGIGLLRFAITRIRER
jgi:cytochrome bd-type quinol oxidase subunit 2